MFTKPRINDTSTARKPGQVSGQKTHAVVETREVDAHDPRSQSTSLQSYDHRNGTFQSGWRNLKHYFGIFQGHHALDGWKPMTLRAPILGGFIVISLALIVVLEILSYISAKPENGGGLAFASDTDSLSAATSFGYLYLPTILAVCYSMIWSWVDLDVKRLEPWFQLSHDRGATAEESLLLQYPFDFLPFIPFTAFKRKHWGVFYAGFIMIVLFWVVTPLQSAIFNTGTITRLKVVDMITSATLMPFEEQSVGLNANFMNLAYAISWLDQGLPQFTTLDYAVLPFQPLQQSDVTSPTKVLKTTVDAFTTNLTCTPAEVIQEKTFSYTFSNGKGCTVPQIALVDTQGVAEYMMTYIGYFSNPQSEWALQNPNCSIEFSNTFLAVWASAASRFDHGVYRNITALFCETSYTSQQMHVSVNASSQALAWGSPTNNTDPIAVEKVFNTTNFEYLLGTGVPATTQRANLQDTAVLQQYSRIKDFGLIWPVSNMVGFAVALNNGSIESLFDPVALQQAFQRAHQVLFVSAFSTLIVPRSPESPSITSQLQVNGTVEDILGAVILVRPISIVVEVALAVIVFLALLLWHHSHYRPSELSSDPASIGDIMCMMPSPSKDPNIVSDYGTLTTTCLENALMQKKFRLSKTDGGTSVVVPMVSHNAGSFDVPPSRTSGDQPANPFIPVQPLELQFNFGVVFIAVLLAAFAAVVFLQIWSTKQNGIIIPSNSQVVRSIIENYAPTAFATLIEPVWTMLNRLLCLLQPFEELRKGRANASASVAVKYTSLPPQLAIWRALRVRHFVLAAVCVVTVSTNLLAVALSALIEENPAHIIIPFDANQNLTGKFNGTPIFDPSILSGPGVYFDHFYIALANISEGTPLPPWIDEQFFYLPFDLKSAASVQGHNAQIQSFRGVTTGIGTQTTCVELSEEKQTLQFEVNSNGSSIQFFTSHRSPNQTEVNCFYPRSASRTSNDTTNDLLPFRNGSLALEAVQTMKPATNGTDDDGICASSLIMGWVRVSSEATTSDEDSNPTASPRNVSKTFLSCSQKLLVADFDVVVDRTGRVMQSNQTTNFTEDTSLLFSPNVNINNSALFSGPIRNESDLFKESTSLIASFNVNDFNWHNDSFTSDWMNTLLSKALNSSSIVDPGSPRPNATVVAPLVEDIYEQLFAILVGLNTHILSSAQENTVIPAEAIFVESRLFVSPVMFALTIGLISLHLIVAAIYYARRPKRFLPRLPTSVASIIAFVSASRAVDDFQEKSDGSSTRKEQKYAYGRFIGTDGKTHVGIEQQRFVVPLKSRNPEVRRRKWGWTFGKEDERQPKTWI